MSVMYLYLVDYSLLEPYIYLGLVIPNILLFVTLNRLGYSFGLGSCIDVLQTIGGGIGT